MMTSILLLGALLPAFGYLLLAVTCAALILLIVTQDSISYEDLSLDEIETIEDVRAELAQKAVERARKATKQAQEKARAARFDALCALSIYQADWLVTPTLCRARHSPNKAQFIFREYSKWKKSLEMPTLQPC